MGSMFGGGLSDENQLCSREERLAQAWLALEKEGKGKKDKGAKWLGFIEKIEK